MGLLHTGYDNELVYIQTKTLTLTIKRTQMDSSSQMVQEMKKESRVSVTCDEDFDIWLSGDAETVLFQHFHNVYMGEYNLNPLFFEL